ncbi:hypothetical protein PPYR_15088 [Photinus pyralis]|uniref:C2H2-type domain-containing protein n=1 Tax=Photinus pyralis TaxID=7054 RepID=A0A5N3ZZL9_PHOPY|nr:uncharacterized protein LOC116166303 [Photinus pyralis]XP_031358242.1 uncharacterized protein LOC116181928 [Photinus pyralis]KAB0790517.1 hypothetical protein PPYR_15088 [Photinus pyralis]
MFNCNNCKFKCSNVEKYDLHQYLHRNKKGAQFFCIRHQCNRLAFKTCSGFRQHIFRHHRQLNPKSSEIRVKCNVKNCIFIATNKKELCAHMRSHIRENVPITCPFISCASCKTVYKNVPSFKTHVMRKHFDFAGIHKFGFNVTNEIDCNLPSGSEEYVLDSEQTENVNDLHSLNSKKDLEEIGVKYLADLYLTLESSHFLCQNSLTKIIRGFSDFENLNHDYMLAKLRELDNESRLNYENVASLLKDSLFGVAHNKVSGSLRTTYMRHNFYKKEFQFVEPLKIDLGVVEEKDAFFYYVPIHETLKSLLNDPNVNSQCFSAPHVSSDGVYRDYYDGICCKDNTFFSRNKHSLKIILYQDSFEICNPLGSARNKYKITGIYMTLANLYPWNRTRTEQIQLIALCFDKHIKHFGFGTILRPLINDLKILEEEGLRINENVIVKGSILCTVGDNLGSHQIGGFLETFNVEMFFCRFCKIQNFNGSTYFGNLRTVQSYDHDVNMALTINNHFEGIKHNSPLNELNYFHVALPGLPPCLAHDLVEGVIARDLMLAINYFVQKKYFSYEYLNFKLRTINFLFEKKQSVPVIKKSR